MESESQISNGKEGQTCWEDRLSDIRTMRKSSQRTSFI